MQLTMIEIDAQENAALVVDGGYVPLEVLNKQYGHSWHNTVWEMLEDRQWEKLLSWYNDGGRTKLASLESIPQSEASVVPLYYRPHVIWGVGANYREKAEDMSVVPPDGEPICFMKPTTSLIGHGENIVLPALSDHVTAEGEIGIVIGQRCKHVQEEDAWDVVAGVVPTLDMTAQDIHARNPRFLGRSKVFDTFFSFGPTLITLDEINEISELSVETLLNGESIYRASVEQMIYSIPSMIHYFSSMMTLQPGDIIMTGTPGSVLIKAGDRVGCRIAHYPSLENSVIGE